VDPIGGEILSNRLNSKTHSERSFMPNRRVRVHHTVILGLEPAHRMSVESMRVAFFLFVSFVFFLIIIGLLALGSVMSPVRWNERSKPAR
jgi:hypothetical protein